MGTLVPDWRPDQRLLDPYIRAADNGRMVPDERDYPPEAAASTWRPRDLTPVLDGTWQRAQPTVGLRADGVGILYPGKDHSIVSETEGGKTWFALSITSDELHAGRHVAYLDFEDDEGEVGGRLLLLGVPPAMIRDQFHYIRPEEPLTGRHLDEFRAALNDTPTSLGIIDGVTEAMALHGLDPLDNVDAAKFRRMIPEKIIAAGAAAANLDHVPKATDNRGRYAIGAVHKINALSGAQFLLTNRTTFTDGGIGRSTVNLGKDRPGQLRRHALPSSAGHWFGDLVLDSRGPGPSEVSVEAPHGRDENWRPTKLMETVSILVEQRPDGASKNLIEGVVTGKATSVRQAINYLVLDGYLTDGTPHKSLKPYRSPA